jgi:hypothetical protein
MTAAAVLLLAAAALLAGAASGSKWTFTKKGSVVSYDERSLLIDGRRDLFFSGAIHYPRSPPEMWPKLLKIAKEGGLNTIETYVFWNAHEPEPGKVHSSFTTAKVSVKFRDQICKCSSHFAYIMQYNFEGRYDMIKFLKLIQDHNMYAVVRIGPFIQAEWNHGFVNLTKSISSDNVAKFGIGLQS